MHSVVERARESVGGAFPGHLADADAFLRQCYATAVDLLARWAATGDVGILSRLAGWLVYLANHRLEGRRSPDFSVTATSEAWKDVREVLAMGLGREDLVVLEFGWEKVAELLSRKADRELRILLVGDCLLGDVVASLHGLCLENQISLRPTTLAYRVTASLRNEIRRLDPRGFDLVFYSPFSHAFDPSYERLLSPRSALLSSRRAMALLEEVAADVRQVAELLVQCFECPVYIHNTAAVVQHSGGLGGWLKLAITARLRAMARQSLNARLDGIISGIRAQGAEQLHKIDEMSVLAGTGAYRLGRVQYDSGELHPTLFGTRLAEGEYLDALVVRTRLWSRKVIVCDLDNTLWAGAIGEGAVVQHLDRQAVLRQLRERGVLLTVCSKNDPGKVRWEESTLGPDDFVDMQINWDRKSNNIKRIAQNLNLKAKDFVFLDDRADERELVKNAVVEIEVMDPGDEATWRRLDHWSRILPAEPGEDRTRLYRERRERERFVASIRDAVEPQDDAAEALAALELAAVVRMATRGDVPRATELINRTNQFNLCGTRTTNRELYDLLAAAGGFLVLAEAKDKFGSMGIVAAMILKREASALIITGFVLSCRAFGFGIELAILNAVRRFADGLEVQGRYIATPHNEPCRRVYETSGFHWTGEFWRSDCRSVPPDPAWLRVEDWFSRTVPRQT